MKINQDDLNKYPELIAFINATNSHDQEQAFIHLKPTYSVSCTDHEGKNKSHFRGVFGLTPLIIISALGLSDHLEIILKHNLDHKYSNSYYPGFLAQTQTNWFCGFFSQADNIPDEKLSCMTEGENLATGARKDGFFALRVAATYGHLNILQTLLQIPKYQQQLTDLGNIILRKSVQAGHVHIVSFLLAQAEILARLQKGRCHVLGAAVKGPSLDILEELLAITPAIFDQDSTGSWNPTNASALNYYMITAIKEGYEEIACRLLQIPEIKAGAAEDDNHILRIALFNKKFILANQLLDLPSVHANLAARNGRVLHVAARTGNIGIIHRLLALPAVMANVDSENNKAIAIAAANGHTEVVNILLAIPQVASTVNLYKFKVLRAAHKGTNKVPGPHNEIIDLLKPFHPLLPEMERSLGKNFFVKGDRDNNECFDTFGIEPRDMLDDHEYFYVMEDDGVMTTTVEKKDPNEQFVYA